MSLKVWGSDGHVISRKGARRMGLKGHHASMLGLTVRVIVAAHSEKAAADRAGYVVEAEDEDGEPTYRLDLKGFRSDYRRSTRAVERAVARKPGLWMVDNRRSEQVRAGYRWFGAFAD